jgi:YesN/AraC family two-component response regulator
LRGEWIGVAADVLQRALLAQWVSESADLPEALARNASEIAAVEVESMVRRLAQSYQTADATTARAAMKTEDSSHSQIEKLTIFISRNYREDITVADVAQAAFLHPNYAMQLFREKCGLSLWDYILRLRVSHAQYLLLRTNRKMSDIARDAGFASDSRFYAAFEKYSGCAPRAWREKMRETKK